jgi:hypothetical protein
MDVFELIFHDNLLLDYFLSFKKRDIDKIVYQSYHNTYICCENPLKLFKILIKYKITRSIYSRKIIKSKNLNSFSVLLRG